MSLRQPTHGPRHLRKGSYCWIHMTTLNSQPQAALAPGKDGIEAGPRGRTGVRCSGKEKKQEESGVGWADGFMAKAEGCRAAAGTLERVRLSLGWFCCPRGTKPGLSSSCSWSRQTPDQGAVIYHVTGELSSATLPGAQSFFCLSSLCQVPH